MKIEHFFLADIHYIKLSFIVLDEISQFHDWCQIHKSTSVASIVITIFDVNTFVTSSHQTLIFEIVNHQRTVMHDFCQSAGPENIFVWIGSDRVFILHLILDRFSDISAVALGKYHAEDGSPSLATSIQKVIDQIADSL